MNWSFIIFSLVKIAIVIGVVQGMVAYAVLAERKISAWIQDRVGPNRCAPPFAKYIPIVGPALIRLGIFQPLADGLKFMLKEDFTPAGVRKIYFFLAPAIAVIPSMLVVAVIPFGSQIGKQKMVIADLNVGILYTFGIVSLGVYGIVLAGYAANSKYPLFGGIRSSAQMISYEISMGMSVIPVLLIVGNLNLSRIIGWQSAHGWMVFYAPVSFIIFLIAVVRGDEPAAVRFAGGGNRTGRRLPHRIRLDEVRAVFPRRIFQHGRVVGDDGDAVFWRLDAAVLGTGSSGGDARRWGLRTFLIFLAKMLVFMVRVHLGALDVPAFPV